MSNFIIKQAPIFTAKTTQGLINIENYFYIKNIVLFFYPKDNTPGCTKENIDFKNLYNDFTNNNTEILGISRDTIKSHENFKCKYDLPYNLISDDDEKICKLYDVLKKKNIFGKSFYGIERSTFLIDMKANIIQEWRRVKVENHAQEVLNFIHNLNSK
ncbi:peroxiredoxin Q/BCP [Candidatus Kinetoplastibacterium desouzaii TCC079E]|uniref:thioredoxin-dependent peroxiredoxin n=1 Tax=Candidatus Kinetoplastidibacterium desouzai TCC079E TaxID=1208919 RepID=M1LMG6_9PROT|nr:peroxiredoxin [Candidatus Kinetoplastibacterium desouzaii]AGF46922.1 peroxiredoxin Q/BCP [Candidatus Kinetoplastibacterium desouzaii TCC079E]